MILPDRIPNLLIIVMALFGITYTAAHCFRHWRRSTKATKAAHIYRGVALVYNIGIHTARTAGYVAPNEWFLFAVILLVSSIAISAIEEGGHG